MGECVNALKQWTGKATASVVYDSMVDEFTADGIFNKVKGKPNVAIVGFTMDGDVLGGFYNVAVTKKIGSYDPNMFIFSFESHRRCETPQRFVVKDLWNDSARVEFFKDNSDGQFVRFWGGGGKGGFFLGNERSDSNCISLSQDFEGIENTTLTGKKNDGDFTCCRLVAIQLE